MTNSRSTQSLTNRSTAGTDPRSAFASAVATATDVVRAVDRAQWHLPTPCPAFDVHSMLAHLVAVGRRVAVIGRGGDPLSVPGEVDEVADDDWVGAWVVAAASAEAAWADDAVLAGTVRVPWGELPGALALSIYISEVTVHTWDLARATGRQPRWDDDAVAVGLDAMQRALPAGGRAETFAAARQNMPPELRSGSDPFGAVVEVPAGAPLIDRLVAWSGRRP